MAGLSFAKKAAAVSQPSAPAAQNVSPHNSKAPVEAPDTVTKGSWLKSGAAAKQSQQAEALKAEERANAKHKLFHFFIKQGEEARITFLNGKLTEDGILDCSSFYAHALRVNGEFTYYICTQNNPEETEECPICAKGDKPAWIGLFTIIDHRSHQVKQGPNAGKVYQHTRKLYLAKWGTVQKLTALASKTGVNGVAGCTFDVSRIGEKSAAVGDTFYPIEQFKDVLHVADKYNLKPEDVVETDYDAEFTYRSPAELIALGVPNMVQVGGGFKQGFNKAPTSSLKNEL